MAPKGKTAVSKEKKQPVLTRSFCSVCGNRMMSNDIANRLAYSYDGFKISKRWQASHRRCASGTI
jgi:hypothetical protein